LKGCFDGDDGLDFILVTFGFQDLQVIVIQILLSGEEDDGVVDRYAGLVYCACRITEALQEEPLVSCLIVFVKIAQEVTVVDNQQETGIVGEFLTRNLLIEEGEI
jgi:hypothetical protein